MLVLLLSIRLSWRKKLLNPFAETHSQRTRIYFIDLYIELFKSDRHTMLTTASLALILMIYHLNGYPAMSVSRKILQIDSMCLCTVNGINARQTLPERFVSTDRSYEASIKCLHAVSVDLVEGDMQFPAALGSSPVRCSLFLCFEEAHDSLALH